MARKAFTLIELLIVVAIIAILALIAVPNFLEAQTRAKVSRVYADMRSVAVAMEAYYVEFNDYPQSLTPHPMTTPIPFITVLPIDAFSTNDLRQVVKRTFEYVRRNPQAGRSDTFLLDYFAFNWPYLDPFHRPSAVPGYLSLPSAQWELKSWGPDRFDPTCPAGRGDDFSLAYDPTNGTISHGDLCRFGP